MDSWGPKKRLSTDFVQLHGTLSEGLIDILADFRFIAAFPVAAKRTKDQRQRISQAIYDVEYKLIMLHQEDQDEARIGNNDLQGSSNILSQLTRSAAQIYVFIALRQMLGQSKLVQSHAQTLESKLEEYWSCHGDISELASHARDLLIWTMVLLLLTTFNYASQLDLTQRLTRFLHSAEILHLEQLVLTLKSIAWMDDILSEELSLLWNKLRLQYPQSLESCHHS